LSLQVLLLGGRAKILVMTPAIEKILAQVNTLTAAEREQLKALLEKPYPASGRRGAALVLRVQGKYSFVPTSSESFASGKSAEIEVEDRFRDQQ